MVVPGWGVNDVLLAQATNVHSHQLSGPWQALLGGLHWRQGLLGSLGPVARGQDNKSSGQKDWLQTHHVVVGDKASKGLGQLGVHGSYRGPGCWCSLPCL